MGKEGMEDYRVRGRESHNESGEADRLQSHKGVCAEQMNQSLYK